MAPTASITGLTYLFQLVLAKSPQYISLQNNFYTRRPPHEVQRVPDTLEDRQAFEQAVQLFGASKWDEAAKLLGELAQRLPGNNMAALQPGLLPGTIGQPGRRHESSGAGGDCRLDATPNTPRKMLIWNRSVRCRRSRNC